MLFLIESYQQTLEEQDVLASSAAFLEQTSALFEIFCDKNRPISTISDNRLHQINPATQFFIDWEREVMNQSPPLQIQRAIRLRRHLKTFNPLL